MKQKTRFFSYVFFCKTAERVNDALAFSYHTLSLAGALREYIKENVQNVRKCDSVGEKSFACCVRSHSLILTKNYQPIKLSDSNWSTKSPRSRRRISHV